MKEVMAFRGVEEKVVEPSEWMVEVAQLWPRRGQWTEADYFALPDTNRTIELSEGELIVPPHPTETHQRIAMELAFRLHTFVNENDLGTVQVRKPVETVRQLQYFNRFLPETTSRPAGG